MATSGKVQHHAWLHHAILGGVLEQANQICLETFRWLSCHLDAVLQQLNGEPWLTGFDRVATNM